MANVELSVEGGIATVLLNRPEALNSLSFLDDPSIGPATDFLADHPLPIVREEYEDVRPFFD